MDTTQLVSNLGQQALPIFAVFVAIATLYISYRIGRAAGFAQRAAMARKGSLSSLAGKTAEQWAPFLEGFPGRVNEARFLGAPIDYVVFRGLADGEVTEIVFVEVKSGRSKLSKVERALRDCVRDKRVRWVEHRVSRPDE